MKIIQVNSFAPIRQNKMAFKGGTLSLLEQIEKTRTELESKGFHQEAKTACITILDEAAQRILGGSKNPEDVTALERAGIAFIRNFSKGFKKPIKASQFEAAVQEINNASRTIGTESFVSSQSSIKNPIPKMLNSLKSIFGIS